MFHWCSDALRVHVYIKKLICVQKSMFGTSLLAIWACFKSVIWPLLDSIVALFCWLGGNRKMNFCPHCLGEKKVTVTTRNTKRKEKLSSLKVFARSKTKWKGKKMCKHHRMSQVHQKSGNFFSPFFLWVPPSKKKITKNTVHIRPSFPVMSGDWRGIKRMADASRDFFVLCHRKFDFKKP